MSSYRSLSQFNINSTNNSQNTTVMSTCDWSDFVCDLQEMYNEYKRISGEMTQRTRHVLGEKFSGTFHNKYGQLSVKFDSLIDRAQSKFESHSGVLQDSQQDIIRLLSLVPVQQSYQHLVRIVSHLLVSSQQSSQKYIKQEVFTIKQQLQTIVIKNYQLQEQITKVYQMYQQIKQRLDQEMNYRFQLEKHLVSLQKQVVNIKQENYLLNVTNNSLIKSKHDLDQEVQVTKQQHKILKKSQLIKYDKLKQQQIKTLELERQNQLIQHQISALQRQLQESKNEQQNFIEEIKHLTEIIDNQSYQLDFYKNRQLRESPSTKIHSHDRLHKYEDLVLQNYFPHYHQQSSEKSSLRSFMLSHQKSMGKLTIFQSREINAQRQKQRQNQRQNQRQRQRALIQNDLVLQKISSCGRSLHSFDRQNININNTNQQNDSEQDKESRQQQQQMMRFPLLQTQMTFRPQKDSYCIRQEDVRWTQKRRSNINNRQQQQIQVQSQPQLQIHSNIKDILNIVKANNNNNHVDINVSPQQRVHPNTSQDYPYIQPLLISGKKHNLVRQRSQSITEGYGLSTSFSVSKKLIYEGIQVPESSSNYDQGGILCNERNDVLEDGYNGRQLHEQNDVKKHNNKNMRGRLNNGIKQQQSNTQQKQKQNTESKMISIHMNSNFNLTRKKLPQPQSQQHTQHPHVVRKRQLPKTQSKKEFHQSQPINIKQLVDNNKNNNMNEKKNNKIGNNNKISNNISTNNNNSTNIYDNNNNSTSIYNINNKSTNIYSNNNNPNINSTNNSRVNITTPQWDNKSETNSVNRALIKKNIKAQRQLDQLIQRLQKAQIKIDEYEDNIVELQSRLQYYKQQLTNSSVQGINYKSTINSLQMEITILETTIIELQERIINKQTIIQLQQRLRQKDIELKQYIESKQQMIKSIKQLEQTLQTTQQMYKEKLITIQQSYQQKMVKQKQTYEERLMRVKQHCKQYIQQRHQQQIDSIILQYQTEIKQLQTSIQMLSTVIAKHQSSSNTLKHIQTQTQPQYISLASNVISLSILPKEHNKILSINSKVLNIVLSSYSTKRDKNTKFSYYSYINSTIHNTLPNKYKKSNTQNKQLHINSQLLNINIHPHYKIVDRFKQKQQKQKQSTKQLTKQINNVIIGYIQNKQYKQVDNIDEQEDNKMKSPCLLYKQGKQQLLSTPSTQSWLESGKPTINSQQQQNKSISIQQGNTIRGEQQYKNREQQQVNESFHTVQLINKSSDQIVKQSSSFINSSQQINPFNQQMESFFTCIQFSNQSISQINNNKTNSNNSNNNQSKDQTNNNQSKDKIESSSYQQQILPEDILKEGVSSQIIPHEININPNNIQSQQQKPPSIIKVKQYISNIDPQLIQQSQQTILKDLTNQPIQSTHQDKEQQSLLSPIFNQLKPQQINQFIQVQQPQIITRPRASSKHLKKLEESYFQVTLQYPKSTQKNTQLLQDFYTQSFNKHLPTYFKKQTHFIINNHSKTSTFLPNMEKMYILHTKILNSQTNPNKQNINQTEQTFLLHKKLLINLQTDHKLQLPKSSMLKFITNSNRLIMGNSQIIINSDPELRVSRQNKRCFFMGELKDGDWQIDNIQEVLPIISSNKKQPIK